MNLTDLSSLLHEFYSFKNSLKKKDEDYRNLLNELACARNQKKTLEESHSSLSDEIVELNCTIKQLQSSISGQDIHEGEKRALLEENEKLKCYIKELEQLCSLKVKDSEANTEYLIQMHNEELERATMQLQSKIEENSNICRIKLDEKENEILSLNKKFQIYQKEQEEAILKLQVQHAEKLERVKNQTPKNRTVFQQNDLKNNDIFRQKYMQLEKNHKDEVMQLKEQILKLQMVNRGLSSRNESPCNNPIQRPATQNETAKQVSNFYSAFSNRILPIIKKVKTGEDCYSEHSMDDQTEHLKNSTEKNNKMNCSALADKPKKRKLFNPNIDYKKKK